MLDRNHILIRNPILKRLSLWIAFTIASMFYPDSLLDVLDLTWKMKEVKAEEESLRNLLGKSIKSDN